MVDIPKKQSNIRSKRRILIVVGLAIVFVSFVVFGFDLTTPRVKKDAYKIYKVSRGDILIDVIGTGRLLPRDPTNISAPEGGEVTKILKRSGDSVLAGDNIFVIQNLELEDAKAHAENEYNTSQLKLSVFRLEMDETESRYASQLASAKAKYLNSNLIFNAQQKLMELPSPPVSEIEYEKSKLDRELKIQLYQVAKNNLKNFKRMAETKVELLAAEVELSKGKLKRLSKRLDTLTIQSQHAGFIQDLEAENGDRVIKGQGIATIVDPKDVFVRLQISVGEASKILVGMTAELEIGGETYAGYVQRISSAVKSTGVDVDIAISTTIQKPKINSYVSGNIVVSTESNVVTIPKPVGAKEFSEANIYVMNDADGSYAERRLVKFGRSSSNNIVIENGVRNGESVLILSADGREFRSEKIRIN